MLMVTFFLTLFFGAFFLVRSLYYLYQCEKSLYEEEIRWDLWGDLWDKADESRVFGSVFFLASICFGVLWAVL